MKKISFGQACILLGYKGVEIQNEKHETINSWVMVFQAQRYYTSAENLNLLKPELREEFAA